MSTITTINGSDGISNSRTVINTNFANLNTDKIETSTLDTDNTLSANSDSKIPTQKAVKAYVDAGGNVNATTTTKGIVEVATQAEVDAGTATGATGASLIVTPDKLIAHLTDVGQTQYASVSLSSSDILNGHTTPKQLIAAPGANKIILVERVVYKFTVGTQYAGAGGDQIRYNGDSNNLVVAPGTAIFNNASSFIKAVLPVASSSTSSITLTNGVNKAVEWSVSDAYTGGTGTATIMVVYRIISV